jgi:hypothetical protein
VDRVDDRGVVDPAQVRGGHPEISMVALYDQERHPSRDISDTVGMLELVGCEPAANTRPQRGAVTVQFGADRGRGERPAAGRSAQNAKQGADRHVRHRAGRGLPSGPVRSGF